MLGLLCDGQSAVKWTKHFDQACPLYGSVLIDVYPVSVTLPGKK